MNPFFGGLAEYNPYLGTDRGSQSTRDQLQSIQLFIYSVTY